MSSQEITRSSYEMLCQTHLAITMKLNGIPNSAKIKKLLKTKMDEFYDAIDAWEYRALALQNEIEDMLKKEGY